MLWVLKRTVSMRRFFWAHKTYVKTDGYENIDNFTLKQFVYLNRCLITLGKFMMFKGIILSENIVLKFE